MSNKLTDEQLAELTEEERAGMLEEVDEDAVSESDDHATGGDSDTDSVNDTDDNEGEDASSTEADNDDDSGDDGDSADADSDTKGGDAESVGDEAESEQQQERQALFNVDLPEDIDEQISSIDSKKLSLADEYDEGLMTYRECQEKINALDEEQHNLRRLKDTAELQNKHEQAQAQQDYDRACAAFLAETKLGVAGEPKFDAFNAYLINFQSEESNQAMPIEQQLRTAYTQWAQAMGIEAPNTKPSEVTRKREVPTTLAGVPSSQVEETGENGRFAALDRMAVNDPVGFEESLMKMSSADRESYLST